MKRNLLPLLLTGCQFGLDGNIAKMGMDTGLLSDTTPEADTDTDTDTDADTDDPDLNIDNDGDGFTENQNDCDDTNPAINPNGNDVPGDGIDQDCDGSDAATNQDNDNDGSYGSEDCDDNDPNIHPGAPEIAGDGIDKDCDGADATETEGPRYEGTEVYNYLSELQQVQCEVSFSLTGTISSEANTICPDCDYVFDIQRQADPNYTPTSYQCDEKAISETFTYGFSSSLNGNTRVLMHFDQNSSDTWIRDQHFYPYLNIFLYNISLSETLEDYSDGTFNYSKIYEGYDYGLFYSYNYLMSYTGSGQLVY